MNIDELTIKNIDDAFIIFQPTGKTTSVINRKFCAISFSLGGKIVYTHNGKDYVSDYNHALFHPIDSTYKWKCIEGGEFYVLNFTPFENHTNFASFDLVNPSEFHKLCSDLKNAFIHNSPTSEKMSILYSIISQLTRQNKPDNSLNTAIRIIESEYQSPTFSIKKLSQECNMSESYFRRKFTDQYGVSPKKYLCDIRIAMAKRMLIEGLKNVSEISEQCGFASVYHFSRAFKLSVGETPKEFAKKQSL